MGLSYARFPDFFIVGHKKSGTTALYEMLRSHPQMFMPAQKDSHFFATDRRPTAANPRDGRLPRTMDEYLLLFAGAAPEQRVGEASGASRTPSHAQPRSAALPNFTQTSLGGGSRAAVRRPSRPRPMPRIGTVPKVQ